MISVYLFGDGGPQGYRFREFETGVLSICEQHQLEHRASAFAFILHDSTHPEVNRVLQDRDYWASLNTIAGHDLTVFSLHASHLRDALDIDNVEYSHRASQIGRRARTVLQVTFGLEEVRFPALLFFQVQDTAVLGTRLVTLRAITTDQTYRELANLIRMAAEAVRDSVGKPIRDPQRAFERIEAALRERRVLTVVKAGIDAIPRVNDLLKIFFWD
jgi:hypothetical protein